MEIRKKITFGSKYILLPIALLFLYLELGNLINQHLLRFIPGPILGMILLLISLKAGIVPYRIMQPFSRLLVRHISFFLIPTSVAILSVIGTVGEYIGKIFTLLILSLIAVMTTVGYLIQAINRHNKKKERNNHKDKSMSMGKSRNSNEQTEVPHD